MTVVYDKFDWQIEKKIQSELVIKHFRLILEWLDNKGLLSDRGKELLVSGLDCNVSLSSNMVTDKGDSFLSKYYGEYKEAISDGKDEKACLQLLDSFYQAFIQFIERIAKETNISLESKYKAMKSELEKENTPAVRVQEIFAEWWERRLGEVSFEEGAYVLSVQISAVGGEDGISLRPGWLCFPVGKLSREQVTWLADGVSDGYITWGAGRAAAIALVPLPLADVAPLMANEAYMIYRLAECHGYKIDQAVVSMLAGVTGGSFAGKILASMVPFLKIPIAAGITYAVGKAAKAYFASGMTLSKEKLKEVFTSARKEADTIDWSKRTVEEEPKDGTPSEAAKDKARK